MNTVGGPPRLRASLRRLATDDSERWRTSVAVAAVCASVVAMRLVYVWQPLRSDEGGYLFVARHWNAGAGEFLYGDYHVDRPPLLLALYRLAALVEWDGAIRVLSIPFAVAAVVALARAACLAAGWRAARWTAVVAGAFVSSPALAADQADGGLFAVPFVAVSLALVLEAWRRGVGPDRLGCAVAAGVAGATASLVKQSFLEGVVFVGVLIAAEALRERRLTARCVDVGTGFALGVVLTYLGVVGWAFSTGVQPLRLWADLVAFRGEALAVIWSDSIRAPMVRAGTLVLLALASAMVPLAWTWLRSVLQRGSTCTPVEWAVTGMLLHGAWAMIGGGSYWPHYLLQLTAALALGTGLLATADGWHGEAVRRWAHLAAASAVVLCAAMAMVYAIVPRASLHEHTGRWLATSGTPGDTAFVAYGHPSVLEAADMDTPYPYLWSLPMRTLDPRQERLRQTLAGPEAPTWIVGMNHLNSWGIDQDHRLRELLQTRYRKVAEVCGNPVWLRADVVRDLAAPPKC